MSSEMAPINQLNNETNVHRQFFSRGRGRSRLLEGRPALKKKCIKRGNKLKQTVKIWRKTLGRNVFLRTSLSKFESTTSCQYKCHIELFPYRYLLRGINYKEIGGEDIVTFVLLKDTLRPLHAFNLMDLVLLVDLMTKLFGYVFSP